MPKIRFYLIFAVILLCGIAVTVRLFFLQIQEGDLYRARAQGQQESLREVHGDRGRIFFNGHEYLATNEWRNLLYFSPDEILSDPELVDFMVDLIGQSPEELSGTGTVRWIIDDQQANAVRQLNHPLLNRIEEKMFRFYPQNEMAAHVVGFLGGYQIGQYGLEEYYEMYLQGESGLTRRFNFLNLDQPYLDFEPDCGSDLYLTLDYNIQFQAEQLLRQAKEDWGITGGTIIVSEPKTGRILALANYPSYNPNSYGQEEMVRFLNPATQSLFEPGSIFKVVTMAAGLNEEKVTPETTYYDSGSVSVGGPPIYNYRQRVWGEQTMMEVLNKSINTGSVFVQQELGRDLFLEYVERFGFTRPTGIDLAGEEFSTNQTLRRGYARDLATASFGQGIATTPIQLVTAINAIANDGVMMKPFLVDRRVDSQGQIHYTEPEELGTVVSPRAAAQTTLMMVDVVGEGYGSLAQIKNYLVAGKTGTAQVPKVGGGYLEETIHGFFGYAPALDPAFSILIKLDAPSAINSSESAAPIFKELGQYILSYYQIPPDIRDISE
jgi:cell division protein FtsI (penicillin-binding protein 3)/stage V sporulation protein D (sporulation-specific penicillin-binding protein)